MHEPDLTGQERLRSHRVGAVRALSFPNFRVLSASGVISGATFFGEMVVLGWLVLQLTDSPFMVGLAIGLRQAPSLVFGIPFGAIADRFQRRTLLVITAAALAATTLIGAGLLQLDWLDLWPLLALNFVLGAWGTAVRTLRQSMTYDIVGAQDMVSGLAITLLAQRLGGILGALGAGAVLAATDAATTYAVITVGHVITLVAVLFIRSDGGVAPIARESVFSNLKEFAVEVGRNRSLATLVLLTGGINILGFSVTALMPSIARDVLGLGADGLGLIQSVGAIGGMVTVVALAVASDLRRKGLVFLSGLLVFGASLVWLGQSSSLGMVLAAIVLVNSAMAVADVFSQGLMQSAVPNEQRGRAAGAWQVAAGVTSFGNLLTGAVAAAASVSVALTINGGLLFTLAGLSLMYARRLRRL